MTSPSAGRPPSRSRCSSCSTRCCRAMTRWRCARTWSWGAPTRSSTCCSGATCSAPTDQPEQAILTMPILVGTDGEQEDVEVAGQPHRHHRRSRGDVRQDAEPPRRGDGRVLPAAARPRARRRAGAARGQAGACARAGRLAALARGGDRGRAGVRPRVRAARRARGDRGARVRGRARRRRVERSRQ